MSLIVALLLFLLAYAPHIRAEREEEVPSLLRRTWRGRSERAKRQRQKKLLEEVKKFAAKRPTWFEPHAQFSSERHSTSTKYAVLTSALSNEYYDRDGRMFCGTLRQSGFEGEIVVAVQPDAQKSLLMELKKCKAIVYVVGKTCVGADPDFKCTLRDPREGGAAVETPVNGYSPNVIRYQLYQWWAMRYETHVQLMISDWADVFFQSDPFSYRTTEWSLGTSYELAFSLEPHPNKVISRCPFNSGWISSCYGNEELRKVGSNPVICSGVVMGTRNALLSYSSLLIAHLDPRVRGHTNNKCASLGMDQGLTNWLVYSGLLDRYTAVKVVPQGEGPVNTVGAFYPGQRAVVKMSLKDWKVLRTSLDGSGTKQIVNWNGDPSPCVHQADRFLGSDDLQEYDELSIVAASKQNQ